MDYGNPVILSHAFVPWNPTTISTAGYGVLLDVDQMMDGTF